MKIATDGVAVSPKEFGAGLVNFTIANLDQRSRAASRSRARSTPRPIEIAPGDADTIKVQMKTGSYEASVDGFAARPFGFTVGPERPSGQNQLLLP